MEFIEVVNAPTVETIRWAIRNKKKLLLREIVTDQHGKQSTQVYSFEPIEILEYKGNVHVAGSYVPVVGRKEIGEKVGEQVLRVYNAWDFDNPDYPRQAVIDSLQNSGE